MTTATATSRVIGIKHDGIEGSSTANDVVDPKDRSMEDDNGVDPKNDNVDPKDAENGVIGTMIANNGDNLVSRGEPSSAHNKDSYGNLSIPLLLRGGRGRP